jgi:thiosulfate/3-mercaptopyruvate sulfurtransferase
MLVSKEWVKDNLTEVRLVDCRFNLGNSKEGYELYKEDHIPGAVYADLEKNLSGVVSTHGGRHPLPHMPSFKGFLEGIGIDRETTVVAYDGGEGAFASRFSWLLQFLGHSKVYILNGGYKDWVQSGFPVDSLIPVIEKTNFAIDVKDEIYASYHDVVNVVNGKDTRSILIDSREAKRYRGEFEPIDRKAGHIPGAINKVWTEGLEKGFFKEPEKQKERFSDFDASQPIIVYCGSGVTAAPNYIALKHAGFENVKVYIGSFSDWISYDENPVAISKVEKES